GGGDAGAGRQVGGCADRRVLARGEREPAAAEAEVEQHLERAAGFLDQVAAGDADVCGAVRDELGDVLRADEQREELAAERREQRALAARLQLEARALEQLARAVGQPPLVGQRDADHGSALLLPMQKTAARRWTGRGGVFRIVSGSTCGQRPCTRRRRDPSGPWRWA